MTFFISNKVNKYLVNIVNEYLMITKENTIRIKKVLYDPPSVLTSVGRHSSIKSQSLQFRLIKYGTYFEYEDHWSNADMCIISFHIYKHQYNLLFPSEIPDLMSYFGSWDSNIDNIFYIFLYIPKIDIIKTKNFKTILTKYNL